MQVSYSYPPIPGRKFTFTVTAAGPGTVRVFLRDKRLAEWRCKDPPCHEVILIPKNALGQVLAFTYQHLSGQIDRFEIPVSSDAATPQGTAYG